MLDNLIYDETRRSLSSTRYLTIVEATDWKCTNRSSKYILPVPLIAVVQISVW